MASLDTKITLGPLLTALFSAALTWMMLQRQADLAVIDRWQQEVAFSRDMIIVLCGQSNEHYRAAGEPFSNECSDWATSTNGPPL